MTLGWAAATDPVIRGIERRGQELIVRASV
jgi:hypothetical protein